MLFQTLSMIFSGGILVDDKIFYLAVVIFFLLKMLGSEMKKDEKPRQFIELAKGKGTWLLK